jgi:hypothetical protein
MEDGPHVMSDGQQLSVADGLLERLGPQQQAFIRHAPEGGQAIGTPCREPVAESPVAIG